VTAESNYLIIAGGGRRASHDVIAKGCLAAHEIDGEEYAGKDEQRGLNESRSEGQCISEPSY
jgi:hypothetical protein